MSRIHDYPCRLLNRRGALQGIAAAAVASAIAGQAAAQTAPHPPVRPPRTRDAIDVHHHVVPPFYKDGARAWLTRTASNVDDVLEWTPERSLAAMDAAGVATAVLSISAPGLTFASGAAAVTLARRCNDYAAGLQHDHSGRFRFFTALPMPDVAASIAEMDRAFATLRPAGIGLLSNYDGRYLGDPAFLPLFERAAAHNAVVYVHPTSAPCCQGLVPGVLDPLLEFPVDTGRAISSLLWAGVFSRFPTLRVVFSHGGGILPMVAERISAAGLINHALMAKVPEGPRAALAKLFVDTASVANPGGMGALRGMLADRQILFGTDFPWGDVSRSRGMLEGLRLPSSTLAGIERDNAVALLGAGAAA